MRKMLAPLLIISLIFSGCQNTTPVHDDNAASAAFHDPSCVWEKVITVYDGDTIKVSSGDRIRYIGIDTPELYSDPPEAYAQESAQENQQLLSDEPVCLLKDALGTDQDKYGRLLRYVYLPDGTLVNQRLVEKGWAEVLTTFPFEKVQDFETSQKAAQDEQLGIWKNWNKETPSANDNGNQNNLSATNAKNHFGEYQNITLTVQTSHDSGKAVFLNSEKDYKKPDNFTVVIFAASKKNFTALGISDPAKYYLGKKITVSGKIKKYQGKAEIIVGSPKYIQVLE